MYIISRKQVRYEVCSSSENRRGSCLDLVPCVRKRDSYEYHPCFSHTKWEIQTRTARISLANEQAYIKWNIFSRHTIPVNLKILEIYLNTIRYINWIMHTFKKMILAIKSLSLRRVGLLERLYWIHFSPPPITIQYALVHFFVIIRCKLNRKLSVQYVLRNHVLSATTSWRHIKFRRTRAIPEHLTPSRSSEKEHIVP